VANNSDYTKNNTDFYDLLPEIYQKGVSRSVFNNLFNRYVTKPELIHKDGYVGIGNPNATIQRQLQEPTPNRQAYQLQPILSNKIGTVDHMMSYEDILSELRHMGVDTNKLDEWFTPQKFNWVPPIDIDKVLNYIDYYWYNPDAPNDQPQYFTIKNICNIVKGRVEIYENMLAVNGSEFAIKGLDATTNTMEIIGDYVNIFAEKFIFFTRDTSNPDLLNRNWTVESSSYDSFTNRTSIIVNQNFNNDTIVNGVASLTEFLDVLAGERDCICNGSFGFDKSQFDDNQIGTVLWNEDLLAAITHATFAGWIGAGNNPSVDYDIWYDTTTDTLKQFDPSLGTYTVDTSWVIVQNVFSIVVEKTEGEHFFDLSLGCEYPRNQWVDQNKWTHKSLVPNFAIAKQAEIPIIEFEPFLELNDWACTTHKWAYRASKFDEFVEITDEPNLLELTEVNTYDITPKTMTLNAAYGDLTPSLPVGKEFTILESVGALFDVINVSTGLGGDFIVSGDVTPYYTDINDVVNLDSLPHVFKIRNSLGGVLDHDWTIESIDTVSQPGNSIITIISTEFINTFSIIGSQVYASNTATYTVNHSLYEKVKTSYSVASVLPLSFTIILNGDFRKEYNFDNFFFADEGVFTYTFNPDDILSGGDYDPLLNTSALHVTETLPAGISEIFIDNFRTVIHVDEDFNVYEGGNDGQEVALYSDGSRLVPSETSQSDTWRAYDEHWLYLDIASVEPINHQSITPNVDLANLPIQVNELTYGQDNHFPAPSIYAVGDFEYSVGISAQRFRILNPAGLSTFEFHEALHGQVRPDTNLVRVYVQELDDNKRLRQYGTYDELVDGNGFVYGIQFTAITTVPNFAEVIVEIGSSVLGDSALENVFVRIEPDQDIFEAANPAAGKDLFDLTRIRIQEQIKVETNQYPLFDIYDVYGNSLKRVSKIFSYVESPDAPLNFATNRRLVIDGSDYLFEQGLVDEATGEMYTYRNYTQGHHDYYVNSITHKVLHWDNFTWNDRIQTDTNYLTSITSNIEPMELFNRIEGQIWYRPVSNELYVMVVEYDVNDVELSRAFETVLFDYSTIDLTLKTIWQPGLNSEKYEPKYVDGDRVEVAPIGSEEGDWELADPLYYNVHHENHKEVKMSELIAHFRTIIESQPIPIGFSGVETDVYHLIMNPNYGLGGTIREYNESVDTLFASVFLNSVTLERIIDFAHDQYETSLVGITELYIKNAVELLTDLTIDGIIYQQDFVVDAVLKLYENNDVSDVLYSDSPTYDGVNGVQNWIATLPFFGLSKAVFPQRIDDAILGVKQILHHDGHYSSPDISDAVRENIIRQILIVPDERINSGDFLGNHKLLFTSLPPTNITDYLTAYGDGELFTGKYWYTTLAGTRTLYRLNLVRVGSSAPGVNYPEGSFYYDSVFNTLYTLLSGVWTVVTTNGDGIIESAWIVVDVEQYGGDILLDVETRLYEILEKPIDIVLDYDGIANSDVQAFNQYESEEFSAYATLNNIALPYTQLGIYNSVEPLTWNYYNSDMVDPVYVGAPTGDNIGGAWQDIFEKMYGTAYPHLEPWKLQGYHSQPDWWASEYQETDGSRRWIYDHATTTGMWNNILNGIIPAGYNLPSGELSFGLIGDVRVYSFFSVNIGDVAVDGYASDELFPPFWNHQTFGLTADIRSLFYDFTTQIIQPQLDYEFGMSGGVEWEWRNSSKYRYDKLFSTFRLQPLSVMKDTFGIQYNIVNELQVNRDTAKIYSHEDALFHGDLMEDNNIFEILGTNQWYSNFNRFSGYDTSASDFRSMWTQWSTPLTYQFASFIDDQTFNVFNKNYDMVDEDYNIAMKQTLGINEELIDSFQLTLLKIPIKKIAYDNDHEWVFEMVTRSGMSTSYYDVKNYDFVIDENTGIATFNKFKIIAYDEVENCITVDYDLAYAFVEPFTIVDSTDNDGTYTPTSAKYDTILDVTVIKLLEPLNPITVEDGYALNSFRTIDWETGQELRLESTELLPRPFVQDTPYYFIKINSVEFALAENYQNALDGIFLNVQFAGSGRLKVGELTRTFQAISGINDPTIWKRYTIDKGFIRNLNNFSKVQGIQTVVDIITGYESITEDDGWVYNKDSIEIDEELGRVVNWQLILEQFINELAGLQIKALNIVDTYDVQGDATTDEFTFLNFNPSWGTGTRVVVSSLGELPDPLSKGVSYYLIRYLDNPVVCRLALSTTAAFNDDYIDLTSDGDVIVMQQHTERQILTKFELNPFRNNIWFEPEFGIVSHIVNGSFPDFKTEQTVFDQYTRTLYMDNLNINREDKITKISILPEIKNDVEPQDLFDIDSTKYIHIGGMHIFIDGYEHVIRFNNYTTEGFLMYDPFVGLNTKKFELLFDRQPEFNLRPNIGGKIMLENNEFVSNMETLTLDLQNAFNTYSTSESSDMTKLARKTLGYNPDSVSFFDNMNVNDKSQFLFWRGMLQAKGSVNAIKAFINSRQFVAANLDEFWAYQIAEYGDVKRKTYPELKLVIKDSLSNEMKFEFTEIDGVPETNFKPVEINDDTVWYEYPNQQLELDAMGTHFYFNAEATAKDETPTWLASTLHPADAFAVTSVLNDGVVVTETIGDTVVKLVEGVDYERVNASVVKMIGVLPTDSYLDNISIYSMNMAKSKHNPLKIIDYKSDVTIQNIPLWNPAKNHHYHIVNHLIDLTRPDDPAEYNEGSILSSGIVDPDTGDVLDAWSIEHVGDVWMDDSALEYYPYYDEIIEPSVIDRMEKWGRLADYAEPKIYQWTESDISPDEWDDVAAVEELDKTIANSVRKSGTVRECVYNVSTGLYEKDTTLFEEYKILDQTDYWLYGDLPYTSSNQDDIDTYIADVLLPKNNIKAYKNGELLQTVNIFTLSTDPIADTSVIRIELDLSAIYSQVNEEDLIKVIHFKYDVIEDERVYPTAEEIEAGDYIVEVPNTQVITTNEDGTDNITYYFWVRNKTTIIDNKSSLFEMETQIVNIPVAYALIQNIQPEVFDIIYTDKVIMPIHYNQVIIKGLSGIINDNDRYKLRFTHDFTLRDDIEDGDTNLALKNTHQEWKMFRESQPFHIDRWLWDRATESILGTTLDGSLRIPSLDKEIYDLNNLTDTKYGIETGQIFIDKDLAIDAITKDLFNPDNDFYPVDIDSFINRHSWDSQDAIISMMDDLYNAFASEHVNRIYFSLLHIAFSLKLRYPKIMKTSMVSLHGIRILDSQGFDD